MSLLLAGTAATVVSAVVTRVVELAARRRGAFDEPNERSSHTVPTPRLGGLGIIAGVSAVALIGIGDTTMVVVLVGATLMGVLGLIDDLRGIPAIPKLASQVALAAGVAILAIPSVLFMLPGAEIRLQGIPAAVVAIGWIVLVSNAVNFMDGTDGLIGTSLFIAATAVALAGSPTALLGAAIAGACLGFLVWNRPPASIFMGDAGSQYLGFLFAGATLLAPSGPVPFGAILLAPLLFDVILTLLRRAARGAPLMTAHREHLYQRIADVRGHGFVALLFGAATGLTAIAAHLYAVGPVALQALALALGLLAVAIVPVIAHLAGKPSGT